MACLSPLPPPLALNRAQTDLRIGSVISFTTKFRMTFCIRGLCLFKKPLKVLKVFFPQLENNGHVLTVFSASNRTEAFLRAHATITPSIMLLLSLTWYEMISVSLANGEPAITGKFCDI